MRRTTGRWRKKALALIFVLVSISASACMDPVSISKDPFVFRIKNDMAVAVVVEGCGKPACTQVDVRYTLAPHSSIKQLGQPDGAARSWKILTISGSTQVLQSGFVIFPVDRVGHAGAAWSCAW